MPKVHMHFLRSKTQLCLPFGILSPSSSLLLCFLSSLMGCGGSRLNLRDETVPAKLRPLLQRRFEEIKKRRHAVSLRNSTTLSEKQLLKDGGGLDGDPSDDDQKSVSSQEDSVKVAAIPESVVFTKECKMDKAEEKPLPMSPKVAESDEPCKHIEEDNVSLKVMERLVPSSSSEEEAAPDSDKLIEEERIIQHDKEDECGRGEANTVEEFAAANVGEGELIETARDDDDDEGRPSHMDESYMGARSPSFRIYFLESLENVKDDEDKDEDTEKKSLSEDSADNTDKKSQSESMDSDEGSATKRKKKEKNGYRIKTVIPKGKHRGVRNLLNVKSCYMPGCTRHGKARLLAPKTAS